ncbi:MAG: hypothetical protein ACREUF_13170 [Solimonas sp.]
MTNWMHNAIVGFIAGALSVLVFHQLGFWLATELGLLNAQTYSLRPVPPWGVPIIVSSAFWGGLWGIVAAFAVQRFPAPFNGVLGWILFAGIVVTLVNWFIVLPIKGAPVGGGFRMNGVVVVPVVYAVWGFGMWVIAGLARAAFGWRPERA